MSVRKIARPPDHDESGGNLSMDGLSSLPKGIRKVGGQPYFGLFRRTERSSKGISGSTGRHASSDSGRLSFECLRFGRGKGMDDYRAKIPKILDLLLEYSLI